MRSVRRTLVSAMRPEMWRHGSVVPAFWWDGHPNFGDALTPWLLPRYGVLPVHRSPGRARLAGVGSIVEFLPPDYDGAVWGAGLIRDEPRPLPRARVLAVRGPLTRVRIGADDTTPVGDPGLLAARWLERPVRRWDVALVPHGHHRSHEQFMALAHDRGLSVRVVNVHQGARAAVREIAACGAVVTTSLHGLVTADSFGIPAVWMELEPPLDGGDFKFRDYEAAVTPDRSRRVSLEPETTLPSLVNRAWSADRVHVARLGDALERALEGLADVPGVGRFPSGLIRTLRAS